MEQGTITEQHGNLLEADADALINAVNTVGVMGKGLALQFKHAYPEMFQAYRKAAQDRQIELGRMHVWETKLSSGPRYVINFPTKKHWRSASTIESIETGLADLVRVVREFRITSIAIPPLGCGYGGLDWQDVDALIRRAFADLTDTKVLLFVPDTRPVAFGHAGQV